MRIEAIQKFIPPVYKSSAEKLETLAEKLAIHEYEQLGQPRLTTSFLADFQKLIADKVKLITDCDAVDKVLKNLDVMA